MDEIPGGVPETPIRIDYDRVDVSDIMMQLRRRIAAAASPSPAGAAPGSSAAPAVSGKAGKASPGELPAAAAAASPSPAGAAPGSSAAPPDSGEVEEDFPDDVPAASPEERPGESEDIPPAEEPDFSMPYPELPALDGGGGKSRIKRLLLKLMRPFSPLIKLLILPVNEELVRAVRVLDYTNRKVDFLSAKFDHDLRRNEIALNRRMSGLDQSVHRRLVAADKGVDRRLVILEKRVDRRLANLDNAIHGRMTTLNENVDRRLVVLDQRMAALDDAIHVRMTTLNENLDQRMAEYDNRLDRLGSVLDVSLENVKLLHNLSHNLVVELTKLKIEHESLRNKARVLEKDFETLTRRERGLEERLPR